MVLDIILILIIALGTLIGYKRGFVKVVIRLATVIIAILLGFLLKNSVADFVSNSIGLKNTVTTAVENKLEEFSTKEQKDENASKINIPILKETIEDINKSTDDVKDKTIHSWSVKISEVILTGISFIIVFVVVFITMSVISLILNTVAKLPILKTLNGTLGAACEFVFLICMILIVLAIISFLSPLEILKDVTKYIDSTCITKWLYENNIIVNIIGKELLKK